MLSKLNIIDRHKLFKTSLSNSTPVIRKLNLPFGYSIDWIEYKRHRQGNHDYLQYFKTKG